MSARRGVYFLIGLLFLAIGAGGGCSLKPSSRHAVRIEFGEKRLPGARLQETAGTRAVASIDDFNCFAVRVSGVGISPDPRESCGPTTPAVGILAGLVPMNGGAVDLVVPGGTRRFFEVFGFQSSIGCPDASLLLERAPAGRLQGVGVPYLLGSATADILTDTAVEIAVGLGHDQARLLFAGCGNGTQAPGVIELQQAGFPAGFGWDSEGQPGVLGAFFVPGLVAKPPQANPPPSFLEYLELSLFDSDWVDGDE